MTNLFTVKEIKKITSKENTNYYWLTGNSPQNFNIGTQPMLMSVLSKKNFSKVKIGDTVDLKNKDDTPYWIFPDEIGDPGYMLGSDGNSGIVWYGKTVEVEKLIPEINKETEIFVKNKGDNYIHDDVYNLLNSPLVQWNFEDGNSILIFYVDCEDSFPLKKIKYNENQVISSMFGAYTDDIMLHEFFYLTILKTLKKIKIGEEEEIDPEEYEELEDYNQHLLGKNPNAKKIDSILDFARHLYCDLLQWHIVDDDEGVISKIFAKKLIKNEVIKNIMPPDLNDTTKLVCINEKSNKEYSLTFNKKKDQFSVDAIYGIIDKKMKLENKILTKDIQEAKNVYLNLIKEKLAKGYDLEVKKIPKNKI